MTSSDRRTFIKKSLAILATTPMWAHVASSGSAHAQPATPTKALDENDPMAAGLGYRHDASAVDTAKYPKRSGPDGAKQLCSSCQFYQVGGLKAEGKDGEWGKCIIFANGLVAAGGWCNSWAPKVG